MRIESGGRLLRQLDSAGLDGVKRDGGLLKTRNAFSRILQKIGDAFLSPTAAGGMDQAPRGVTARPRAACTSPAPPPRRGRQGPPGHGRGHMRRRPRTAGEAPPWRPSAWRSS